jgi:uncharacterized YigZ family protein
MEEGNDLYKTLAKAVGDVLYKERNSKFLGFAIPVTTEEEAKRHLEALRKNHNGANHVCYAWQLGVENIEYKVNDDGEPSNSAGMPIYGQIKAYGITNVLVAVVRYFGGTKLGVGGLISAYRITAQNTLEQSRIIEKTLEETFELHFAYAAMNKVMRIIKKESISIVSQTMELECNYVLSVRKKDVEKTKGLFEHIKGVRVISHP